MFYQLKCTFLAGYTLYRSDRTGGRSHGGCAVYCRDDLTIIDKLKYSNNCCESQVLEVKELELILMNIYRPPNSPTELYQEILTKCQEVIDETTENENKYAIYAYTHGPVTRSGSCDSTK